MVREAEDANVYTRLGGESSKERRGNARYKVIRKFRHTGKEKAVFAVSTYSFVDARETRKRGKEYKEKKTREPQLSGGMNNLRTSDRAIEIHVSGNRFERQITEILSPRPISWIIVLQTVDPFKSLYCQRTGSLKCTGSNFYRNDCSAA